MSPINLRDKGAARLSFGSTSLEPCPAIGNIDDFEQRSRVELLADKWQGFAAKHKTVRQAIGANCEEQLGLDQSYAWQSTKETTLPLRTDYRWGRRWIAGTSLSGLAAAQTVGSLRLPLLLAPHFALKLGEAQHPVVAGVALGSFYAAWNCTSAEVLRNAMSQHPNTVNRIAEKASKAVDFCENSLPGLETSHKSMAQHETDGSITRMRKKTTAFLRLGYTAIGVGVNPSVATAQMKKRPRSEIRRIYTRGSLASGTAAGITLGTVAVAVPELAKISPVAAELIGDGSKNPVCLFAAAALIIAIPKAKKRWNTKTNDMRLAEGYEQIGQRLIPSPQ